MACTLPESNAQKTGKNFYFYRFNINRHRFSFSAYVAFTQKDRNPNPE